MDLGGYVYAETEDGSDAESTGTVVQVPEMPGVEGTVSDGEGNGVLSALRDDHDADNEGIGTEEASLRLEAEEE